MTLNNATLTYEATPKFLMSPPSHLHGIFGPEEIFARLAPECIYSECIGV